MTPLAVLDDILMLPVPLLIIRGVAVQLSYTHENQRKFHSAGKGGIGVCEIPRVRVVTILITQNSIASHANWNCGFPHEGLARITWV